MTSNQYVMFLQRFIKNPKRVGSVLPSLRSLASKMVQSVSWEDVSTIAEFGSGTGAITRFIELFNFKSELRETLLHQITESLKPEGKFIAFQYSLQMKKHLSEKFIIDKIDFVPLNFPPAFVYTCRKKEGI
ncbi:hypothetical protein GMA19_04190 [Paenibacillus polymyxa E681]|uniref:class I SAM-dependent methyltransferase n=1 Tax=Paenibacillus polymyxa TaxID=1406 RepID=UPI0001E31AEF|nr:hypothetical protein [Paenibacillus polymyxa]ADM71958.1 hypothetical protein PPE_04178 [Paenibacillus polymyxa E681]QNV58985.1 hypothetical protein GE561_04192 [Paenibacillus polymyxa E681]QNV63820.1 hypothetical protein GMA19_04190 [Paenibacillus polymyxa E681]